MCCKDTERCGEHVNAGVLPNAQHYTKHTGVTRTSEMAQLRLSDNRGICSIAAHRPLWTMHSVVLQLTVIYLQMTLGI